jgi:hypothetical protein
MPDKKTQQILLRRVCNWASRTVEFCKAASEQRSRRARDVVERAVWKSGFELVLT